MEQSSTSFSRASITGSLGFGVSFLSSWLGTKDLTLFGSNGTEILMSGVVVTELCLNGFESAEISIFVPLTFATPLLGVKIYLGLNGAAFMLMLLTWKC